MGKFNIESLLQGMLEAFVSTFETEGKKMLPQLQANAEVVFKGILLRIRNISILVAEKKLDRAQAKILLNMDKLGLEEQLLTDEGASKILLQKSINAAINAVCDAINKLVGWNILGV